MNSAISVQPSALSFSFLPENRWVDASPLRRKKSGFGREPFLTIGIAEGTFTLQLSNLLGT
jgi:hypothetical protein